MDSFHITTETANELITNHGFRFSRSERRLIAGIGRLYLSGVYQVFMESKTIFSLFVNDVPFMEMNTDHILELMVLPTDESRAVIVDSSWNLFTDAMHSAKLLHEAMCFAH